MDRLERVRRRDPEEEGEGDDTYNDDGISTTPKENRGQKYKMPEFAVTVGSKAQVYHGTAKKTAGGLEKKDLVQNKHGRIVSRRKQAAGKKALKFLIRKGYKTRKGHFHLFNKYRRMTRRQQGGFF